MQKIGECIAGKRLKFKTGLQAKFIRKIKEKSNLAWKPLANEAGVSDYTLRIDWLEEKSTIPYSIAAELLKKYPFANFNEIKSEWVEKILPAHWGQKIGGSKAKESKNRKKISIPAKSEELAEIFGAILGDGHLDKRELTITSAFHEKRHLLYLKEKLKELFGVDSKVFISHTNKNVVILDCYSTELVKFLSSDGLVVGHKIRNKACLPKWILEKDEFIFGALRGLFDTDGGIYHKQKGYARAIIEFQTMSPSIRRDIVSLLTKTRFTHSKSMTMSGFGGAARKTAYDVRLQNQEEVSRFFMLVGSSNPNNIIRYKHFIYEGCIPPSKSLYNEIINYGGKLPFK